MEITQAVLASLAVVVGLKGIGSLSSCYVFSTHLQPSHFGLYGHHLPAGERSGSTPELACTSGTTAAGSDP